MDIDRHRRIKQIAEAALELPPGERTAHVAASCAGDASLHADVMSLLDATRVADSRDFLAMHNAPMPGELGGEHRYRILHEIGRGGMGAVYLGERADGEFKQQVAIKLLHLGSGHNAELQRRFRAERQILADLDHPNIARLIDGGSSADGRPFLAMEYVEGDRLDRWIDAHDPPLTLRIALFAKICRAVQAAHRRLIVHRDLKPANILIDRAGEPKLLDFGIAKLLDDPDAGAQTGTGMQMLTPRYAAPEQVRGAWVGTATDVYALGVILYEIICGRSPYPPELLTSPALLQAVCDTQPRAPSAVVGAQRGATTDPRQRIGGDLDAIVLKCLRKEADARYASAGELADDLDRLLRGDAVHAMSGHRGYQLRKFIERHRALAIAATSVLLILIAATLLLSLQLSRTERERARAEAATAQVRASLQRVQRERDRANSVTDFLGELFREADPLRNQGRDISMREALTRGAARLDASPAMDAQTRAALFSTLAHTELNLGAVDRSLQLAERALADLKGLGEVEPDIQVQALMTHAAALREKGRYDDAEAQFVRAWSLLADHAGIDAADILSRRGRLASDRGDPKAATTLFRDSADLLVKLAKAKDFDAAMRDAEAGPLGEMIAVAAYNLCSDGQSDGEYVRALALCESALGLIRRMHGERDSRVANILNVIGNLHSDRGDHAAAAKAHAESLAIVEQVFGAEHTSVGISALNLGVDHFATGDYDAALAAYQRAGQIFAAALGAEHRYTLIADNNVADVKMYRGDLHGALADHERILAARRRAVGDESPEIARSLTNIARLKAKLGQVAEAVQLQRDALARHARVQGEQHPETLMLRLHLAQRLADAGEFAESEQLAAAVEQFFVARNEQDAVVAAARFTRARALAADAARHDEAMRLANGAADYAKAHPGNEWIHSDEVDAWLKQQRKPSSD